MTFMLKEKTIDDKLLLQVEGEIDIYTCTELKDRIYSFLDKGIKELTVDLSKVTYIDSTGLGVFIGVLRNLKEIGGSLKLLKPTPRVGKVLKITGLDRVFDIVSA